MKKKMIIGLLIAAVAITAVSGCGNSTGGNESGGKITITIGEWPPQSSEKRHAQYEAMREEFMLKNPDIDIQTDTWGFDLNTFLPKAASGQLPSVYITSYTEIQRIIDSGYASDVTKFMNEYGYSEAINSDIKNLVSKNNKIYAVPQDAYLEGLYINMNLFRQTGLVNEDGTPQIPKTWEELGEMAQYITEKTGVPGFAMATMQNCGGWQFLNMAWGYGTDLEFMDQIDGKWKANFATPECEEALKFVRDLKYKYKAVPDNALLEMAEVYKMFATDRVAMMIATPIIDALTQTHKMDRNNIAIASMPAGPKGKFAQMGGNLRVLKNGLSDDQIAACFKWFEFIGVSPNLTEEAKQNQDDSMRIRNEDGKLVGVKNFSIWKQEGNIPEVEQVNAQLLDKYSNADPKLFADFSDFDAVTIVPEPPINCQQLYNILDGCIQEVLLNESADPMSLLQKAQSDFQINYLDKAE